MTNFTFFPKSASFFGAATGGRCRRRSALVALEELGCEMKRDFGAAGFLAAAREANVHECEDSGMLAVFVGNQSAENVDTPDRIAPAVAAIIADMRAAMDKQ